MENKKMTFEKVSYFMDLHGISVFLENDLISWDNTDEYLYFVPNVKSKTLPEELHPNSYILMGEKKLKILDNKITEFITKPCKKTLMIVSFRNKFFELEKEIPFYGNKRTNLINYVENFNQLDYITNKDA